VPKNEYDEYCKHTIFEHYLFNCLNGDKLLALGIGSLFNHSDSPNVDYRVDSTAGVITYKTSKQVKQGDELFIYYGSNLWFSDVNKDRSNTDSDSDDSTGESDFITAFNLVDE